MLHSEVLDLHMVREIERRRAIDLLFPIILEGLKHFQGQKINRKLEHWLEKKKEFAAYDVRCSGYADPAKTLQVSNTEGRVLIYIHFGPSDPIFDPGEVGHNYPMYSPSCSESIITECEQAMQESKKLTQLWNEATQVKTDLKNRAYKMSHILGGLLEADENG